MSQANGTLLASQTVSAAGNSAGVDVDGLSEVLVVVEVSAPSSFSGTFYVDTLLLDGTWDQVAVTSAITTASNTNINLGGGSGVDFGNTIRARWTASGSATVAITFVGK